MREWSGAEIKQEKNRLEQEAAALLGRMIFEFSRLEFDLGLYLAWSNDGSDLEQRSEALATLTFDKRLKELGKLVDGKFRDSPDVLGAYANWLAEANAIRATRNDLFHGRWGVEATAQRVINVVGLPTGPDSKRTEYSIADLEGLLDRMRGVRSRLEALRSSHPV